MLKDITLGQYFPGDTLAHRLDPRTKLLATVLYIIAIFLAKGPIAYGVLILTLIVSVRISKVGARVLFRGLKPVLFIIAFTAVLNLFYTPGTVIAQFWIFHVTREGVITAVNDVGIIVLPNGRKMAVSVFVMDSKDSAPACEKVIASMARWLCTEWQAAAAK